MNSLSNISITLQGIGHILSDHKLEVPIYQRSYAWEEKHILDLFQDISSVVTSKDKEYFLGSIVVTNNDNEKSLVVVDGQQRLATITIFFAAIRDYFLDIGDINRANDINAKYLVSRHLRTQEYEAKLKLNEIDNDFFYNKIINFPKKEVTNFNKESHQRILKAYDLARKHIEAIVRLNTNHVDSLVDWIDFINDNVKIIWVQVPDDSNAFTIFETLNDRGLDLAISDLLKNYLFHLSGDRMNEIRQKWIAMSEIIEANADESEVVSYIRNYWSSRYGVVREKDLYKVIKKKIDNKQAVIDFSEELASNSKLYSAILNSEHEYWNDFGTNTKSYISTLKLLNLMQIRPLLISILKKFSKEDINKSLKLLLSVVVRYIITGTLSSGRYEKQFSQWAIDISESKIKNVKQLAELAKRNVPGDREFKQAFSTASVLKSSLARYYLRALEQEKLGQREPEFIPNYDERQINLEHILPLNPSREWDFINPDDIRTYSRRVGNMVLLQASSNSKIGNDSFINKIKVYKSSSYQLTQMISKFSKWNLESIEERQKELAILAVKTWSLKT